MFKWPSVTNGTRDVDTSYRERHGCGDRLGGRKEHMNAGKWMKRLEHDGSAAWMIAFVGFPAILLLAVYVLTILLGSVFLSLASI